MLGSLSSSSKGTARRSMRQQYQRAGGGKANHAQHRAVRGRLHTCKAIRDVCPAFGCFAEQQADDAFPRVLRNSIVMINDAEQHKWVNDHLLWRCHKASKRLHSAHRHRCKQPAMLLVSACAVLGVLEMGLCTGFFWCIQLLLSTWCHHSILLHTVAVSG